MTAPATAYTARSVALVGAVVFFLVASFGLIVAGCWAQWGWPIGLVALGGSLLSGLLLVAKWPTPKRGQQ